MARQRYPYRNVSHHDAPDMDNLGDAISNILSGLRPTTPNAPRAPGQRPAPWVRPRYPQVRDR